MKIRPLIIDTKARRDIHRVMAYADKHRVLLAELRQMADGTIPPLRDNPHHVCIVQVGFRCVYSIEEQKTGWVRHASFSVLGPGNAPNKVAVDVLLKEFGFGGGIDKLDLVNLEKIGPHKVAINCWKKLR